ncbi:hypothetical protein HXP45_07875 [Streptomyces actuosus]|uniref:DUF4333 domain-containing protein n=1 Tax=Streptomyces actuosus TaxID=1885 RepID=A0A2U9P3Q4_STRAS|nr:hypothetical protein DMT42_17170 [Streptomyces actuosus]MBM4820993.1 hypothetical protein [Streptomyces actuosus]
MGRKILGVGLVVVGVLVSAGCSSSGGDRDAGGKGAASPAASVLPQKLAKPGGGAPVLEADASPAAGAAFSEQLEYELRGRTLKMAGAPGATTATCPDGLESSKGTTTTCSVTYDGLKVEWTVRIGDNAAWSDQYVQYEATPNSGILTRDGVARLLYGNYSTMDYALCNDIPAAALVPLNTESKYRCEIVFPGKQPTGYASPVRATEAGPRAA